MLRREKPVCITKRPASNSIQSTDVSSRPACTCAYLLRHSFPLASSRRLISFHSIAFLPRIGCEEYYQSPGRASFSRFRIHRAGSPFFQILHILSTSTYAALNFEALSKTSHATLPLLRPVSLSQLSDFFWPY